MWHFGLVDDGMKTKKATFFFILIAILCLLCCPTLLACCTVGKFGLTSFGIHLLDGRNVASLSPTRCPGIMLMVPVASTGSTVPRPFFEMQTSHSALLNDDHMYRASCLGNFQNTKVPLHPCFQYTLERIKPLIFLVCFVL
jgi:hypothetical protein